MARGGVSSRDVTVGLGGICIAQPVWSTHISPGSSTFHEVGVAPKVHLSGTPGWRKGVFCREVSGLPEGLCWWVRWPPTSTWRMMLFSPWRTAPNGTCFKTLAWLARFQSLPPPHLLMKRPRPARPRLLRNGLSFWTAVFIFSQCMCLILCWSCKREGPRCVAKFSRWGCTRHSANSTYHC